MLPAVYDRLTSTNPEGAPWEAPVLADERASAATELAASSGVGHASPLRQITARIGFLLGLTRTVKDADATSSFVSRVSSLSRRGGNREWDGDH